VNGHYPSQTYVPECTGIPENIVTTAWSGEYSKVELTEDVNYTFISSISIYFLTISDENGSEVLVFGTTPVTFTPDVNMVIRFYSHINSDCESD